MTTVEDFGEYTDLDGALSVGGTVIADITYDVRWRLNDVTVPRAGKRSKKNLPGEFSVTTVIKKVLVKDEATTVLGKSLNDTPVGGTASTLHAGLTAPGSGAENITDMTTTAIATASRVRFIPVTDAITVGGRAIVVGTNSAGGEIEESVDLTAVVAGAVSGTTKRLFKTVTHVVLIGTVAAGATIAVTSIIGASSFTVGDPEIFDLVGSLTKGSNSVVVTQPNCWFKNGGIAWGTGGTPIDVSIDVGMYDPDTLDVAVV
jgi:hypothetical protein